MMTTEEKGMVLPSTRELVKWEQVLKKLGYEIDEHYYTEKVYAYDVHYEVTKGYTAREDEDDFSFEEGYVIDIESIHTERRVIGYLITNIGGEIVDLNRVDKVKACMSRCAVCGALLVLSNNDRRVEEDGPKCFDHIGVEAEKPLGPPPKREMPPLPIVGKPMVEPEEKPVKMAVLI